MVWRELAFFQTSSSITIAARRLGKPLSFRRVITLRDRFKIIGRGQTLSCSEPRKERVRSDASWGSQPHPQGWHWFLSSPREAAAAACTLFTVLRTVLPAGAHQQGGSWKRGLRREGHVTSCRSGSSCQAIKSFFYLQPKTTTDGPGRTGDPPGPSQPPPFPADKI